ncbi:hypothetical protein [Zavarzinia sp. CC-PAN008]|uniref:hypothetical protein n=1 Tax=Zavarzinia sp. CC-PAN008 TaxID=3243332 RepID=UPI003F74A430
MSIGGLFGPAPEAPEAPAIPRTRKAAPQVEVPSHPTRERVGTPTPPPPLARVLGELGPRVGDVTWTIVRVGDALVPDIEAAERRARAELAAIGLAGVTLARLDPRTVVGWAVSDHAGLLADLMAGRCA